ncbi:sulfatase family protein [Salegentibacter sp. F14]
MDKITTLVFGIFLLFSNGIVGQKVHSPGERPNVIVFIADDVTATDLGPYGNHFVHTPNIDYLARNGITFNNAILTTSSCSPSRISILTGRYPHNTGAAELHTEPKVVFESIASKLDENGYYTGQAGKWHMGSLLKQGFDQIYEKREQNGDGGEDMWIQSLRERDKNNPFFFWFASYDAHRVWGKNQFSNTHDPEKIEVPKTLVDNDSTRIDLVKYYDEIKRFDFHIGKVIEELKKQKVFNNTIIIVMADNGRPFPRDKTRMYHSGVKTPLIIHWTENIDSAVSNSLISSIDIAPTVLDICGVGIPETFQGKSFKDVLDNPSRKFRNYAFAEHNWHDHEAHERMVRTDDFMYILNSRPYLPNQGPADAINSPSFRSLKTARKSLTSIQSDVFLAPRPTEELYELKEDSLQIKNIANDKKYLKVIAELKGVLLEWMEETNDNVPQELTKDWYSRDTGEKNEYNFNIRGEMPGEKLEAEHCNAKGPF